MDVAGGNHLNVATVTLVWYLRGMGVTFADMAFKACTAEVIRASIALAAGTREWQRWAMRTVGSRSSATSRGCRHRDTRPAADAMRASPLLWRRTGKNGFDWILLVPFQKDIVQARPTYRDVKPDISA